MGTANGLKAVGVGVILFSIGFASGFPLLFRLGYALVALTALGLLWTLANLIGLEFIRETRETRVEVGQTLEERLGLRNRLFVPKLWLECRDHSTLRGHGASRALDLGPRQKRKWTVQTTCGQRGRFLLGPITVTTGDPFGLFRMRRRWRDCSELLVYPATVEITRLGIPQGPLMGGNTVRRRFHDQTPNSLGVRDYQSGDSLHRIHWPSTARLGTLMVKECEPDRYSDVWLVLDAAADVQRGSGDESTEEYAVKIAASLAKHFLQRNRAVGLIADGGQRLVLLADRGYGQLTRVLEALAVLHAGGRRPIYDLLSAESPRFRRGNTVFVITPTPLTEWGMALTYGSSHLPAVAVLLNAASFDGQGASMQGEMPSDRRMGVEDGADRRAPDAPAGLEVRLPCIEVNCGDDIAEALSKRGAY